MRHVEWLPRWLSTDSQSTSVCGSSFFVTPNSFFFFFVVVVARSAALLSPSSSSSSRLFFIKRPTQNGFHSETRVLGTMRERCCTPIFSSFLTRSHSCLQCVWPAKTERRSLATGGACMFSLSTAHTQTIDVEPHRSAFYELSSVQHNTFIISSRCAPPALSFSELYSQSRARRFVLH